MNQVIPFSYKKANVRTVQKDDGSVWFVAKDVCDVLGVVNARKAVSALDDDEKNTVTLSDGIPGNPNMNIVNEFGLYMLIMRSKKPEATPFKRWVTHEVLPSIRKTGSYSVNNVPAKPPSLSLLAKELYAATRISKYQGLEGNQIIIHANRMVRNQTGFDCMKMNGVPKRLVSSIREAHLTPSDIGKQIGGLSGRKINQLLQKIGLQESFRDAKGKLKWKPTEAGKPLSVSKDTGKAHHSGTPVVQLFWLDTVVNLVRKGIT